MYAVLNGAGISFDVIGAQWVPDGRRMRDKPVCLVFHGGPGASHCGTVSSVLPLQDEMQFILLDDRSCGRSERRDLRESSMKQNAADGEALRQYLGLGKVFVMGSSYGGMTAQRYALDYPENVRGLILVATGHNLKMKEDSTRIVMERGNEEQKKRWQSYLEHSFSGNTESWLKTMGSLYQYHFDEASAEERLDAYYRGLPWSNPELLQYQMAHELADFESIDELPNIKCPVAVFAGKQDFMTPCRGGQEIHEAIPQSEFHLLDECAHYMFADQPEYMYSHIMDFVNRNYQE